MSSCKLDHSWEDVKNKLSDQKEHLPQNIYDLTIKFLSLSPNQHQLNELFHLLKKYDLATNEEKQARNKQLITILE